MIVKEISLNGLNYNVFQPDPVMGASMTLVEKEGEGFLIDTQFSSSDAKVVIDFMLERGIKLVKVFITHSDPDFYFGLPFILEAFPHAKSYATQETIDRIEETWQDKLKVWSEVLKEGAPTNIVIPHVENDGIDFKGQRFNIVGRDKHRTQLYNEASKVLIGGITVIADTHVFMADTKTLSSQRSWVKDLEYLETLAIDVLIPGHFGSGNRFDKENIAFTKDYINTFIKVEEKHTRSDEIITEMTSAFPDISEGALELSVKVVTGEMDWQ